MSDWKNAYQKELQFAFAARERLNEGQARVCARRAAGIVIREHYRQLGRPINTPSAYDLLKMFMDDESQAPALRQSVAYLTLRVSEEFKLPVNIDLVKEAQFIAQELFP